MSSLDPRYPADVLRRIVTGELDPDREPARTLLAESAGLRRELAELRRIEAGLADSGRERAAVLVEAARARPTPQEDEIAALFRASALAKPSERSELMDRERSELMDRERSGRIERARLGPTESAPRRRRGWIAVAATVLALSALWVGNVLSRRDNDVQPPTTLGGHAGCLVPAGQVDAWRTFEWDFDLPLNGSFELSIFDATPAGSGARVHVEPDLVVPRWTYDPARAPALPARIEWRIVVKDGSGAFDGRGCRAEAWLR